MKNRDKEVNDSPQKLHQPGGRQDSVGSNVFIADTSQSLVHYHNGIFGETFSDFLIEYVAFIEGNASV